MTLLAVPVSERDHARRPGDAPVTLLVYSNYECLHCRRMHPFIEELRGEYGDHLRLVYRHFARPADLPLSERAAEAAEAAGAQGRFWEMHAALFEGPPLTSDRVLEEHAARLGLELSRFRADLRNHQYLPRVRADLRSGVESGVRGTPTCFVNGAMHEDSWDLPGLRAAVAAALSASLPG